MNHERMSSSGCVEFPSVLDTFRWVTLYMYGIRPVEIEILV